MRKVIEKKMFSRRQKYLQLLNEFKLKKQQETFDDSLTLTTTTTTATKNLEMEAAEISKESCKRINHFMTNLNCFVYENKSVHWISTFQFDDDDKKEKCK